MSQFHDRFESSGDRLALHFHECGVGHWPLDVDILPENKQTLCHVQVGDETKEESRDENDLEVHYVRWVKVNVNPCHERFSGVNDVAEESAFEITENSEAKVYVAIQVNTATTGWLEAKLKHVSRKAVGSKETLGS